MKIIKLLKQSIDGLEGDHLIEYLNQTKKYLQYTKEIPYQECNAAMIMIETVLKKQELDSKQTKNYCNELWMRFIKQTEEFIKSQPECKQKDLGQALDLIRAINSYREYHTPETLLNAFPELKSHEEYLYPLFKHFSDIGYQELAELYIEMLQEVS